jgi:hypothetical protein
MFGMKDYRAAKLYWLLSRPLNWFWLVGFWALCFLLPIILSAVIHQQFWLQITLQIVISYVVVELLSIPAILSGLAFDKLFYFLIDVEPSLGKDAAEAKTVLRVGGELFKLTQKFETRIEEWDFTDNFDDTDRYYKLAFNWRQKLFFPHTKERFRKTVRELQDNYRKTGAQPTTEVVQELASRTDIKQSIIEKVISTTTSWNSIVRLCIIVITTWYVH